MSDERDNSEHWGKAMIVLIVVLFFCVQWGWFDTDIHGNKTAFGKARREGSISAASKLLNLKLSLPMGFSKNINLAAISTSERYLVMTYDVAGNVPNNAKSEFEENLTKALLDLHCSGHRDYRFLRTSGVPTRHCFRQADGSHLFEITFDSYKCP